MAAQRNADRGWWPWPLVAVLMVSYCLPAPYATLWPDTVRDLAASLGLARGEALPLTGPPVNFGPHLGPAWVWLQALPLLFFDSITAVSVYVAAIASLKFLMLFELGRRAAGARLGICIAAAGAFPSVLAFHWLLFVHPNWVEAAIAAALLLFLAADQRRSLAAAYLAIVTLGLAVQLHPTAIFYFPLAAVVLYRQDVRGPRLAGHLAAMALLVAAWFAPLLLASAAERGALEDATARIAIGARHFSPESFATVLRTAYVDLPIAVGETYGVAAGVPMAAWKAGLAIIALALGLGGVRLFLLRETPTARRFFSALVALLAAAWIIAVAIRTYTSFYLAYFLFPLSAVCMGLALDAAWGSPRPWLQAIAKAAVGALALSLVLAAMGALSVGESAFIESRLLSLGDLAHLGSEKVRGTLATAATRDSFARQACAADAPLVTLHGDLAYALSMSMGVDFRIHCAERANRMRVLGRAPGPHFTALPRIAVEALGVQGGTPHHGLYSLPVASVEYPVAGRAIERDWYHFDQLRDRLPLTRAKIAFTVQPGRRVMIYRLKPYASQWRLIRAERDGVAAQPAFSTFNASVYAASPSAGEWIIEFETDAPQWVDVHAF